MQQPFKFIKGDKNYFDEFKSSLDDACVMGAKVLMLPPFAREAQTSFADDRKRYIEYFARAYELAAKTPVQLTFESIGYPDSPITTAEECLEILDAVPGLKLTYDPGNVATAADPLDAFAKLRQYVVHFHVKDWFIRNEPFADAELKRCGKYFTMSATGEGDLDLKGLWETIVPEQKNFTVNLETWKPDGEQFSLEEYKVICDRVRNW